MMMKVRKAERKRMGFRWISTDRRWAIWFQAFHNCDGNRPEKLFRICPRCVQRSESTEQASDSGHSRSLWLKWHHDHDQTSHVKSGDVCQVENQYIECSNLAQFESVEQANIQWKSTSRHRKHTNIPSPDHRNDRQKLILLEQLTNSVTINIARLFSTLFAVFKTLVI